MKTKPAETIDFRELRTVEEIEKLNPGAFPNDRLRYLIEHAAENGLRRCLVRLGPRSILIHEPRFNEWLTDRLGLSA